MSFGENVADLGGATWDRDRKRAQARTIDLAVSEIQGQIQENKAAVEAFNKAAPPDTSQVLQHGVADSFREVAERAKAEALGQKASTTQEAPKEIPAELVTGWAGFVAEWGAARRSFEDSAYIGADVDALLSSFTKRVKDWRTRFGPYLELSTDVPDYTEDQSGAPAWAIAIGVAAPLAAAGGIALWHWLRKRNKAE